MIPLSRGVGPPDNREPTSDPPKDSFASPSGSALRAGSVANNRIIGAFQHFNRSPTSALRPLASAFTLIEMIVVILIIATLTALFVGAAANTFDRARRTQAKNDVIQIVTAVNAFYTEYGRYPVTVTDPTKDAFFGTGSTPAGSTAYPPGNVVLLNVLRNITTDPNALALNPRQIVFLSPGGAKNTTPPRGGIATADNCYYDPWGSQYAVLIDTNYDNTLTNPYSDVDGSAGTTPIRQGAIGYSFGKNGALGGGPKLNNSFGDESGTAGKFKGSSDILSW
jgi:prepilin-type N-terminal cleavage/methylation domain-containing protein